jgi:hypothetical protein
MRSGSLFLLQLYLNLADRCRIIRPDFVGADEKKSPMSAFVDDGLKNNHHDGQSRDEIRVLED